jgi:SpoVK/Ycf46/Vps4 family AAA+-type ATPase
MSHKAKIVTPILDEKLSNDILNAVVMFTKKTEWKNLGMDKLREQGAALLFHGLPGTGKTITARHLAKVLKLQMHEMDFGMIGSDTPGELARNINKLFVQATVPDTHNNSSLVFLDECDTMLISRSRLGHNSMWMLEPINALLRSIGNYPGLVVLATNQQPDFLDFALERRLIGKFYFGKPTYLTRVKLWRSKYPRKLPLKLTEGDVEALARYSLTGAEIENLIILWVSQTLRDGVEFKMENLFEVIRRDHNDRLEQLAE